MIRANGSLPARFPALVVVAFAILSGCNRGPSNVAPVKGKVSLGGQPLSDATVEFSPTAGGSPSLGKTNGAGEFELIYTRGVKGAEKGEHSVSISTYQPASEESDAPTPEVPEKVPLAYRQGQKPLKADVKSGQNEFSFDLEAGPVNAPKSKVKGKR